jgi:pimeloyl-ACP methyl ester carboxylesterase
MPGQFESPDAHGSSPSGPVLFLSGAGLPTWIWDDVRAALPASVETAVAGRPPGPHASLAEYADAAAAGAPWPTFAVVAHSSGGVVAVELLARHPDRVTGIIGITAVVPVPGRSFVGTMPLPSRLVLSVVMRLVGTRPPTKVIRAGLAGGLSAATADRIVADFEPESVRLYRDATSVRDLPEIRGYVHTRKDKELAMAVQRRSAEALRATWTHELATGHLPMLQDPLAVSRAVTTLLAQIHE